MAESPITSKKKPTIQKTGTSTRLADIRIDLYGAVVTVFALVLLVSLASFDATDISQVSKSNTSNFLGPVGAQLGRLFFWLFGIASFLLDAVLMIIGVRAVIRRPVRITAGSFAWFGAFLLSISVLLHVGLGQFRPFEFHPGGHVGLLAGEFSTALFNPGGSVLVFVILLIFSMVFLFRLSLSRIFIWIGQGCMTALRWVGHLIARGATRLWRGFIGLFSRHSDDNPELDDSDWPDDRPDDDGIIDDGAKTKKQNRRRPQDAEPDNANKPRKTSPAWAGDGADAPGIAPPRTVDPRPSNRDILSDRGDDLTGGYPFPTPVPDQSESAMADRYGPDQSGVNRTAGPGPRIVMNHRKAASVQEDLPLPRTRMGHYEPPSLSLLDYKENQSNDIDRTLLHENARKLERTLLDYKVEGKVVEIHPGPVVTMYEFLPAAGIKISRIANLADDLTMALQAVSIRIVAPIPGKGVVGIEVPNEVRETVYLREILASEAFKRSKSKLTLPLGKNIFGEPVVTDLARMPHLLIAGATGSGKSVAVNAFILGLLRNASPDDVRIILVDPKVVELQVYEGIPHLLLPVVNDPKHAAAALRWAVNEMERRYELLARSGTRNIQSFNQNVDKLLGRNRPNPDLDVHDTQISTTADDLTGLTDDHSPEELTRLPYIVIVLDEFADLMMVASKDVETAVARLAQKARAAGIHLLMATQRPSKEVITGLIKANFPSRVAFRVSSKVDSRIILDQGGGEALLGYGDMLFLQPGNSVVTRVHGSFVSDEEVHRVVEHLKTQGSPDYQMDILLDADDEDDDEAEDDVDSLIDEAQDIVIQNGRASISFLQRKLKIGYNRSARIMEQLERRRVVGPPDHRGERQIL